MEGLKRHMLTHRFSSQSCKECDRDFKSEKDLKRHITLSHTCNMCKIVFIETKDLETHRETSISCILKPKKTISCDQCLNEYENKKLYKEHLKSSKTCSAPKIVKLYSCDACNKVFTSKPKYTKHMKTHSISITPVHPNNDGLIPGNIIKHEQIENDCDSNMAAEFKMADTDSSSSDSENSNMAINCHSVTTDFCLGGTVKLEPIIEESADLNLAGNFMKTADLAGVSESNIADHCASFSCNICKIDYQTSELLQTHLKTKYHTKRAANNVVSDGHADENPGLTRNGETADNNGNISVFVDCSEGKENIASKLESKCRYLRL